MGTTITTGAGLEGVVAGESEICFIDGYAGILSYRGYNIHTLAEHATFEEVIYLLWNGRLPLRAELDQLKSDLVANRPIPKPVVDFLGSNGKSEPMDVLRTAVSMLGLYDPLNRDQSPGANRRKALKLMAQTPAIVSTFDRLRNGRPVLEGDPKLGFAANFLYTVTGKRPDELMERAFDVALILHADHELNASTFAARVTAATLSDIYSAITSAIGALKGPLHGGANQDVIQMLLEAKTPDNAVAHVKQMLAQKKKIPGFGHRVYRTEDPRATHLRRLAQVEGEVQLEVEGPVTQAAVLDALEARYPMLRGTIRDHVTQERRPLLRFFACEEDLSYESPDTPLPDAVASGAEPYFIIGAIAGG